MNTGDNGWAGNDLGKLDDYFIRHPDPLIEVGNSLWHLVLRYFAHIPYRDLEFARIGINPFFNELWVRITQHSPIATAFRFWPEAASNVDMVCWPNSRMRAREGGREVAAVAPVAIRIWADNKPRRRDE